jgi:hypothetical protein
VGGPNQKGAGGGGNPERLPQDAVCAPLDSTLIRVSRLERNELKHAVSSLLQPGAGGQQGWKLYAVPESPVFAVTRGVVRHLDSWRKEVSIALELHAPAAVRLAAFHDARRLVAVYAGLGTATVAVGDTVDAGQVLGHIGESTSDALCYLRFELRTAIRGGKKIDPGELLSAPESGRGAACGSR